MLILREAFNKRKYDKLGIWAEVRGEGSEWVLKTQPLAGIEKKYWHERQHFSCNKKIKQNEMKRNETKRNEIE